MFQINEDNSIYLTRGDILAFAVSADDNGEPYKFEAGDDLTFKVYSKKDCTDVIFSKTFSVGNSAENKDFPAENTSPELNATEAFWIYLTGDETKFGDVISKPKDYWYEIVLNEKTNPQTIVGYDEDGAKVLKLFPEGADIPETPVKPEDIPVVDTELDMTSNRPVENRAIARAFENLREGYEAVFEAVEERFVTPEMFGAIGDGEADDTEALQSAINSGASSILLGNKTYLIKNTLNLKSNISLVGRGAKIKKTSASGEVENILFASNAENITIEGIEFVSEHNQNSVNTKINGTGKVSNIDALHFNYIDNLIVSNCRFSGLTGGVKIDENIDDVTSVINHNVMVDWCVFDDTVFMPIYAGGLSGCSIRNCDISAHAESTKFCHHIYISSACENFYIQGNTFKGGTGQDINAGSAYEGATAPKNIRIANNTFIDFRLLLAVLGSEVFFENNSCKSALANNCIYVSLLGKLKLKNCDISVNTKLLDTEGFDVEMINCTIKSSGVVFSALEGSSLVAEGCAFTITGGESVVDVTSDVGVKVYFYRCVFNTTTRENDCVLLSRKANCLLVFDNCTIKNDALKNFATNAMLGKVYIYNSTFAGFEKLCYEETDKTVLYNNYVLKDIL